MGGNDRSPFQNSTTRCVTAKVLIRTLMNIEFVTSRTWLHWRYKKETGFKTQYSSENLVNNCEAPAQATLI